MLVGALAAGLGAGSSDTAGPGTATAPPGTAPRGEQAYVHIVELAGASGPDREVRVHHLDGSGHLQMSRERTDGTLRDLRAAGSASPPGAALVDPTALLPIVARRAAVPRSSVPGSDAPAAFAVLVADGRGRQAQASFPADAWPTDLESARQALLRGARGAQRQPAGLYVRAQRLTPAAAASLPGVDSPSFETIAPALRQALANELALVRAASREVEGLRSIRPSAAHGAAGDPSPPSLEPGRPVHLRVDGNVVRFLAFRFDPAGDSR